MSAAEVTNNNLLESALWYARNGWYVFPCKPRDKQPLGGNGHHDATLDVDQIAAWWTTTPDANIGIALGASGLFVLDVDGPAGWKQLSELQKMYSSLPQTYMVVTGRAEGFGRHHVFQQPDGEMIRNRKIGDKLETRGDGGYVIAPPSIHPSGRAYLAEGGSPENIAEAPGWLIHMARAPKAVEAPDAPGHNSKRLDALAGRVAIAGEGNRNDTLNWAAHAAGRAIAAGNLDRDQVEQALGRAATIAGLDHAEIVATLASGISAGMADPEPAAEAPLAALEVPAVTTLAVPDQADDDPLGGLVAQEVARLIIRERATVEFRKLQRDQAPLAEPIGLGVFLEQPDPDISYLVDQIWPSAGRVMLAAQFKAGKSTLTGNLLRSLADAAPFLGRYEVPQPTRAFLLDTELDKNTHRRWLRDISPTNASNITLAHLRGRTSSFDITDDAVRTDWARMIADVGSQVVILDCLAPILDACGLSEDKEAGQLLIAFDALIEESGATEGMIVHHMGHSGERTRGASRLRDWPDAEWRLIREVDEKSGEAQPDALRYFTAYGRDVDEPEQLLAFREADRGLVIAGGSRADVERQKLVSIVVSQLRGEDGWTSTTRLAQLVRGLGGKLSKTGTEADVFMRLAKDPAVPVEHRINDRNHAQWRYHDKLSL